MSLIITSHPTNAIEHYGKRGLESTEETWTLKAEDLYLPRMLYKYIILKGRKSS